MDTAVKMDIDLRFGHIEILSSDPHRLKSFYCDVLGFELEIIQNEQYIWLNKGEMTILIRPGEPPQPAGRYEDAPTGFILYTSNVQETLRVLVANGLEIKGTVDSDKCFTFTDPDGNWFQLVDPHDH